MKKNEFDFYSKALEKHERTWVAINGKEYKYSGINRTGGYESTLSGTIDEVKAHVVLVDREDIPHQFPVKTVAEAFGEFMPPMRTATLG